MRGQAKAASTGSIEGSGKRRALSGRLLLLGLTLLALALMTGTASATTIGTPTATNVLSGSAHVSASLENEGQVAYVFVEISTNGVNWIEPHGAEEVAGSEQPVTVSFDLTGLHAGTKYFVRFYSNGFSPTGEFTTLPASPPAVVSVGAATGVTNTAAQITGSVERPIGSDPGLDAICSLEYLSDAAFQPRSEKQRLVFVAATGGTFTLIFGEPGQTTAPLPFNASAAEIQTALEGLSSVGPGAIGVSGGSGGFQLSFSGSLANQNVPLVGVDPSGLTEPGVAYAETSVISEGHALGFEGASITACKPSRVTAAGVTPVTVTLGGLKPDTVYHYQLAVSNAGGSDATPGPSTFRTKAVPFAQTLGASAIESTSATLSGRINPANSVAVTYQFEWGETAGYGKLAPAAPESFPFNDESFHSASAALTGLREATTYHYRIVATNTETGDVAEGIDRTFTTLPGTGPQACPNETSRVGASTGLPDCRAYEWATPDINGISILTEGQIAADALADGSAIKFKTTDAPDNAQASTINQPTVSERGPDGWHSHSVGALSPEPVETFASLGAEGLVSSNYKESLFYSSSPITGDRVPGEANLYLRRADDTAIPITLIGTKMDGGSQQFPIAVGQDQASEDFSHIFYRGLARQLPEDPLAFGNTYDWSERNQTEGHLKLLGILPAEGSTPEAPAPGGAEFLGSSSDGEYALSAAGGLPGLYLRIHGTKTVEVSASKREPPEPGPVKNVHRVAITPDGSQVLFTSSSELTDDAYTGEASGAPSDQGSDLYSYDVGSGELTDLTVDENPDDAPTGANVTSVPFVTNDASFIYFIATGKLAPDAVSGEPNLYVEHDGEIRYIAPAGGVIGSPDGLHVAFSSTANLTGYESGGQAEIYEYSYEGGSIECASCRPSGAAPTGGASIQGRAISRDGSRVFFTSEDAVLPGSASGRPKAYEYSGGKVTALSPGDAPVPVYVLTASESGDDVFLGTYEELVPGAGHNFAIYDARVDADTFVATPLPCSGEACRGAGSQPPGSPPSGSGTFEAPGEVVGPKSKSATGKAMKLRLTVPSGGRLTLSGKGVKSASKSVAEAGSLTLTVSLTPAANGKRLKKGVFKTKLRVRFEPSAGSPPIGAQPVVALSFHGPSKKGGK